MILRPQLKDIKIIGFYFGKMIIGFAVFMLVPIVFALALREMNPLFDFIIGFLFCFIIGLFLYAGCYTRQEPKWGHGMVIVSFSWGVASLLGAIPLYLSGHWANYLDSVFEAMSGLSTTGLVLVNDLDHLSYTHNLWRHLLVFIGGQGIVVIILSFFVQGMSGAFSLYVGEARDERVFPNVIKTTRFIWGVSLVYLVLGTLAMAGALWFDGMSLGKALFHGVCMFMAAFDTGGFAPHSQSMIYYHSLLFEVVTMVVMLLGAMNFRLHYILWSGQRKELWRNFEIKMLAATMFITFLLVAVSLVQTNIYTNSLALFRKGFFQLISAHSGTGFQTIYSGEFIQEWRSLALFAIIFAMSLGGCICSTTGGIKTLRLGIIAKAFSNDIKHYVSPENAVFFEKIHHIKDMILTDRQIRAACLITIAYISIYFLGAMVGMIFKYPFVDSFFESVSATANVGLSCGITVPSMPTALKLTYILQMWAGRLEFIAIFTLLGYILLFVKGK